MGKAVSSLSFGVYSINKKIEELKIRSLSFLTIYDLLKCKASTNHLQEITISQYEYNIIAENNFYDSHDSNREKISQKELFNKLFQESKILPTDNEVNIYKLLFLLIPLMKNDSFQKAKVLYYCITRLEGNLKKSNMKLYLIKYLFWNLKTLPKSFYDNSKDLIEKESISLIKDCVFNKCDLLNCVTKLMNCLCSTGNL